MPGWLRVVLWAGLKFLANFTYWARRLLEALQAWWQGLFSSAKGPAEAEDSRRESRPQDLPALEAGVRRLVALYARAAYARGRLPPGCLGQVRQFWEHLEAVAESPLSAWEKRDLICRSKSP
jgi:hypothetical protein